MRTRTYVHTQVHTYIHTYIHACMHTYIHIHTYGHGYGYNHADLQTQVWESLRNLATWRSFHCPRLAQAEHLSVTIESRIAQGTLCHSGHCAFAAGETAIWGLLAKDGSIQLFCIPSLLFKLKFAALAVKTSFNLSLHVRCAQTSLKCVFLSPSNPMQVINCYTLFHRRSKPCRSRHSLSSRTPSVLSRNTRAWRSRTGFWAGLIYGP